MSLEQIQVGKILYLCRSRGVFGVVVADGCQMVVRVGGQTRYDGMAEGELGEMADGVDVGGWVGEFGDFLVGGRTGVVLVHGEDVGTEQKAGE